MPIVVLDSEPLGLLTDLGHKKNPLQCKAWVAKLTQDNIPVVIPESTEYELRRALICHDLADSQKELNKLRETLLFLSVTKDVWDKAAGLWSMARKAGQQTAHNQRLDIDVLVAAQAILISEMSGETTFVATSNVKHIERYGVKAASWRDLTTENCRDPNKLIKTLNLARTNQSI